MGVLGGLVTCSIIMGKGPVSVVGMKPESMGGVVGGVPGGGVPAEGIFAEGIPAAGIPPAGIGMGCIFLHGSWKVDCVTVWFLDMKLNWIMSYWAAWTLSGE